MKAIDQAIGIGPGSTLLYGRRTATIGALLAREGQVFGLSVAHVFCRRRKARLRFPGEQAVGYLYDCSPLRKLGAHTADAALIAFNEAAVLRPEHPTVGRLQGCYQELPIGLQTYFSGRSDCSGRIVYPSCRVRVRYAWGSRRLCGQVLIQRETGSLPRPGDSGGLWVSEDGLALGIQVAVLRDYAVVTPLSRLLQYWQAELVG